MAALKVRIA